MIPPILSRFPGLGLQHLSAMLFYEHWRQEWIQSSRVEWLGGRRRSREVGGGEERGIFVIFTGCSRVAHGAAYSTALYGTAEAPVTCKL